MPLRIGLVVAAVLLTIVHFAAAQTAFGVPAVEYQWPSSFFGEIATQRAACSTLQAIGPWEQTATVRSFENTEFYGAPPLRSVFGSRRRTSHSAVAFVGHDRFAVIDTRHPVRVFDADTGAVVATFGEPERVDVRDRHIVTSADGRYLTIVPDNRPVIYDTVSGQPVATLPYRQDEAYTYAAFLPDGSALATYRGDHYGGRRPTGRLQLWAIDRAAGRVVERYTVDANRNGRSLSTHGPYLVVGGGGIEIFDALTGRVVLPVADDSNERFLFVEPPRDGQPGVYASALLSEGRNTRWTDQQAVLRTVSLADGKELRRWPLPLKENRSSNDHRFQAGYAISPDRRTLAISPEGRADFFDFVTGETKWTVLATHEMDHPSVTFLNGTLAAIGQQRTMTTLNVVDVAARTTVAVIPETNYQPLASADGRRLIVRRDGVPLSSTTGHQRYWVVPTELVYVVWSRRPE